MLNIAHSYTHVSEIRLEISENLYFYTNTCIFDHMFYISEKVSKTHGTSKRHEQENENCSEGIVSVAHVLKGTKCPP